MRSVDVLVPKMPDQWPSACPQTSFAVPTWARQRGTWAVTAFIFMGGLFVGFFSLKGHAIRSFPITQGGISGRNMQLSIVIPTAVSPASLLISEDERELGLHLSSLLFRSKA